MVRLGVISLFGSGLDLLAGDAVVWASSGRFSLGGAIYVTILVQESIRRLRELRR